jgi:uncharacterized membrane protein HdeD (DUF308 family)
MYLLHEGRSVSVELKIFQVLSVKEKRFIRYWEEQRKGGKWLYFLLYILVGTFIVAILFSVTLILFLKADLSRRFFWIVISLAAVFTGIITIMSWFTNEKKFRKIIQREVRQGQE